MKDFRKGMGGVFGKTTDGEIMRAQGETFHHFITFVD